MVGLLVQSQPLPAAPVSAPQARRIAERWLQSSPVFRSAAARLSAGTRYRIADIAPLETGSGARPLAYRVNLLPRGYLLIGADDRLPPVLAFSADRDLKLDAETQNAFRAMLATDLRAAREALDEMDTDRRPAAAQGFSSRARRHQAEWVYLSGAVQAGGSPLTVTDETPSNVLVTPMLTTSWSQWNHYNEAYPDDPQPGPGYDGKAPVGCIAVAGAQLARFYAWPPRGHEGYTDVDVNTNNLIAGSFQATFTDRLNWDQMQDFYDPWTAEPATAVSAVSELIYRLGVSVDTDVGSFAAGGSSANLDSLNRALNRYFLYEGGAVVHRSGNETNFDAQLRSEITAGRPVPASIPAHAMVVDGLSAEAGGDYFHVNYGWGGFNDGWYRLSDIAGDSVAEAVLGAQPRFMPVLNHTGTVSSSSGSFSLAWSIPASRRPPVERYRVSEGIFAPADVDDEAADFSLWHNYSGGWAAESITNGAVTTCFRKRGEIGRFELVSREVFKLRAKGRLTFRYRSCLVDDHFLVKLSADGGLSWVALRDYTNTGWDSSWRNENVDLSAYASGEVMLSFEYAFRGGACYGQAGAVWIDRVSLRGVERLNWTPIADNVATNAFAISNRLDGTYYFTVEAFDGAAWSEPSPFAAASVALDPALDIDGDGMPNGWETAYFGSATGGVAAADADGDGMSNWGEYQAGTNPTDPSVRLAVSTEPPSMGGLTIAWSSVAGRRYAVLRAGDLRSPAAFTAIATGIDATAPQNRYTDAAGAALPAAFYRVEVERP